jgi:hypothetical protein
MLIVRGKYVTVSALLSVLLKGEITALITRKDDYNY